MIRICCVTFVLNVGNITTTVNPVVNNLYAPVRKCDTVSANDQLVIPAFHVCVTIVRRIVLNNPTIVVRLTGLNNENNKLL